MKKGFSSNGNFLRNLFNKKMVFFVCRCSNILDWRFLIPYFHNNKNSYLNKVDGKCALFYAMGWYLTLRFPCLINLTSPPSFLTWNLEILKSSTVYVLGANLSSTSISSIRKKNSVKTFQDFETLKDFNWLISMGKKLCEQYICFSFKANYISKDIWMFFRPKYFLAKHTFLFDRKKLMFVIVVAMEIFINEVSFVIRKYTDNHN